MGTLHCFIYSQTCMASPNSGCHISFSNSVERETEIVLLRCLFPVSNLQAKFLHYFV